MQLSNRSLSNELPLTRLISANTVKGYFDHHEVMKKVRLQASQVESKLDKQNRKVLILHTGGTIGMFNSSDGYRPQKNKFQEFLKSYPYFCDAEETFFLGNDDFIISPLSVYGRRIWFKLVEMETLIDSSNATPDFWNKLLQAIKSVYEQYDAFVILHGTDTMAYTASALSFAIQNLGKTIVLTGAQIPVSQTRNDSINNLLCSLVLAGHFTIPEVLVVFDNKILRGNRCKKRSSSSLDSFYCPNYPILGSFNTVVEIAWDRVLPRLDSAKSVAFHKFTQHVANIKLTPGTPTIPSQRYVVLESYGCGNLPTFGPIYDWVLNNSKLELSAKQLVLNVSQIQNSEVVGAYQAGLAALKLGVVPGGDMTFQAAVAKLMHLASKGLAYLQIRQQLKKNLRGELTERNVGESVVQMLASIFANKDKVFTQTLKKEVYPSMAIQKKNKLKLLQTLVAEGMNPSLVSVNELPLPHALCSNQGFFNIQILEYLQSQGVDLAAPDKNGCTCLYYAITMKKSDICEWLYSKGVRAQSNFREISRALQTTPKSNKPEGINNPPSGLQLLKDLRKYGDEFKYKNMLGQNIGVYALLMRHKQAVEFFRQSTSLFDKLDEKDRTGRTVQFYIDTYDLKKQTSGSSTEADSSMSCESSEVKQHNK